MMVPFMDLSYQRKQIIQQVIARWDKEVISQDRYIGGSPVDKLMEDMSHDMNKEWAYGTACGTDALYAAFLTFRQSLHGKVRVLVPDFTYLATVDTAVRVFGDDVYLVDVGEDCMLTPKGVQRAIRAIDHNESVKPEDAWVVVPTHLFGGVADIKGIQEVLSKEGFLGYIVEDAAQSQGAHHDNLHPIGYHGDMVAYSFFPTKNFGCFGDGGALLGSIYGEVVKSVLSHGASRSRKYYAERLGFNSRLDPLQAIVVHEKLKHFGFRQERQEAYWKYMDNLDLNVARVITQSPMEDISTYRSLPSLFTVGLESRQKRHEAIKALDARGIGRMTYYPYPMHECPAFMHNRIDGKVYPMSSRLCDTCLSLPFYPGIPEEHVLKVCEVINGLY